MDMNDILGIKNIEQGKDVSSPDVVDVTSSQIRENDYEVNPLNMNNEPNTPFNDILNDAKKDENMYINHENNPLNIPMTRSGIIEKKEKEAEPKEEVTNSSGYFGGPIEPKTEDEFMMEQTRIHGIEE